MQFSSESEAVVALVSLVLSADEVGSWPERKFLFDRLSKSDFYGDMTGEQYKVMAKKVNDQLFGSGEGATKWMEPEGVRQFCDAVRAVVPKEKMESAFTVACEMACTDGLIVVERKLLDNLAKGLGMTTDDVDEILLNVTMKSR